MAFLTARMNWFWHVCWAATVFAPLRHWENADAWWPSSAYIGQVASTSAERTAARFPASRRTEAWTPMMPMIANTTDGRRAAPSALLPQLSAEDRATGISLLAQNVPLKYTIDVHTVILVEPKTGAIVGLEKINQTLQEIIDLLRPCFQALAGSPVRPS